MKFVLIFLLAAVSYVKSHTPYRVEFLLSATGLPERNLNKNGKIFQPFAVVWHSCFGGSTAFEYTEVGRTQFSVNNSNPVWGELFQIDINRFRFPHRCLQKIRVEVYDHDPKNADEFYGAAYFLLDDLLHSFGRQLKLVLKKSNFTLGRLIIKGRESGSTDPYVDSRFFKPTQVITYPRTPFGSKGK